MHTPAQTPMNGLRREHKSGLVCNKTVQLAAMAFTTTSTRDKSCVSMIIPCTLHCPRCLLPIVLSFRLDASVFQGGHGASSREALLVVAVRTFATLRLGPKEVSVLHVEDWAINATTTQSKCVGVVACEWIGRLDLFFSPRCLLVFTAQLLFQELWKQRQVYGGIRRRCSDSLL